MIKNLRLLALLFLFSPLSLFAQNGSLSGTIFDRDTKEPVPYAAIRVFSGGQLKNGSTADENGVYRVSPLTPGSYSVEYSSLGYRKVIIQNVNVFDQKTTSQNVRLPSDANELNEVVVEQYKVPLINKDETSTGAILTAKDIEKLPSRNINTVLTTTPGVFSNDDGGALNIRGNRGGDNIVYVNGVRQYGTAYPPVETIASISVITGGVPAQYGDALGGVISVTTKGAAEVFRAGVQFETSRIFDKYNYTFGGINASGPLWKKRRDTTVKDSRDRTLLGFYTALTYQYDADASPSAFGYLKPKADVLSRLEQTPLVRTVTDGQPTYRSAADFLTRDDFDRVRAQPNSASNQGQFNLTLDYQPADNIVVSLGGNFNFNAFRGGSTFNWFNYDNNSYSNQYNYNGFVRFRQSFPNLGGKKEGESGSSSGLKNFYYQLQADYSRAFSQTEDPRFKQNQELYNYWGRYVERRSTLPANAFAGSDGVSKFYVYQPGTSNLVDSINTAGTFGPGGTRYVLEGNSITQGFPGGYTYEPYANAGVATNINKQILTTEANGPISQDYNLLQLYGGIINGFSPTDVGYNLSNTLGLNGALNAPGALQTSYGWQSNEQYSITGQVAGELGSHNLKLGFEYQQRIIRSFSANQSPWVTARGLINNQIISNANRGTSNSSFTTSYDADGTRVITIDPDLAVTTDASGNVIGQTDYDRRVRQILGLPNNTLINLEQLDPSLLNIKNFTPEELLGSGQSPVTLYSGTNAYGDVLSKRPGYLDFFTDSANRPIDAYRPTYIAGYIEDKFEINDLIVRIGLRVDQFDVNQPVLRDQYSLTRLTTVGETDLSRFNGGQYQVPGNIGSGAAVYLDKSADQLQGNESSYRVIGFRDGTQFYDANGGVVTNYRQLFPDNNVFPLYDISRLNSSERALQRSRGITLDAFQDFKPQTNVMPRLAFSFPVSEDALFFAHYDVLTQRPGPVTGNDRSGPTFNGASGFASPLQYYNLIQSTGPFLTNPALNPQKKIDYQLGFQQRLSQNTALKLSAFYSEIKDLIQVVNVLGGYPNPNFTTNGNIDFGIVKGTTLSFDYRKRGGTGFGLNASYQLQFAEGSASDFAVALLNTNTPNLRNIAPQNWDQRHGFKVNLDYRTPERFGPEIFGGHPLADAGINITTFAGSGNPYTRDGSAVGGRSQIEGSVNGARLPWQNRTGLRIDKSFVFRGKTSSEGSALNVYVYVTNIFNQMNTLDVYRRTGRPDDDGYLASQYGQNQISQGNISNYSRDTYTYYYQQLLLNPDFVSAPRRWRIGVAYSF